MSDLPHGWSAARLGEVCSIVSGATPKTDVVDYWGGSVPWVTPSDLSRDRSQTVYRGARNLTQAGYAACSARVFPAGSVIVSSRAPIGYVAIAGVEMCTNQGCKTAVPPSSVDPRYLYWYMIHARGDLELRASGTTFKEISARRFAETQFRWPRLHEQRRIVEILEDHLSRLDAADGLLRSTRSRANTWRRVLEQGFIWTSTARMRPIADLLREPMRNGHSARASKDPAVGIRTLTLTAVTRAKFAEEFTKLTAAAPERVSGLWLEPGDILVQRSNTPELVGSTAMYAGERGWAIFPDLMIRLRVDEFVVRAAYVSAVLTSDRGHRRLGSRAKGLAGSMPKIDQAAIGSTLIPVPSVVEQDSILAKLGEIDIASHRLGHALAEAVEHSRRLRRALLEAAFSGRLTGRDSDLQVAEELAQ